MKKTGSRWIAWMAVFVLLGLMIVPDIAYGAGTIEMNRECSITFDLSSNYQKPEGQKPEDAPYVTGDGYTDFLSLKIPVDIYKVADVDSSGNYKKPLKNTDLYEALETQLARVSSQTTAAQWMSMAGSAAKKVAEASSPVEKTVVLNDPDSENKATGLTTGLYLVMAREVQAADDIYTFDPYLVSLPGNSYDSFVAGSSDEWVYEVTVGLKASREPRYGDLEIVKTLNTYNATLGGATFVFQVEAEKENEKVYSNVVSISFDAPGTRPVKIEGKIPSGASVTVTEVYTGASYKVTSDAVRTAVISAEQVARVSFTNDYDERLNGGTSVVNHFIANPTQGAGTSGDTGEEIAGQGTGNTQETQNIVWDVEQLHSTGQTGKEQQ